MADMLSFVFDRWDRHPGKHEYGAVIDDHLDRLDDSSDEQGFAGKIERHESGPIFLVDPTDVPSLAPVVKEVRTMARNWADRSTGHERKLLTVAIRYGPAVPKGGGSDVNQYYHLTDRVKVTAEPLTVADHLDETIDFVLRTGGCRTSGRRSRTWWERLRAVMTSDAGGVMADPYLAVFADHAGRAVARQAVKLDEHRARAATLFTAASVAGAFLGAESFKAPSSPGTWAWAGAVMFALAGCDLAYVMWPRLWRFHIDVGLELDKMEGRKKSVDAVNKAMAVGLWEMYEQNDRRLKRLTLALAIMVILAVGTVLAFFVNLAVR